MKIFNTLGTCRPAEHDMTDIAVRLETVRTIVAKGGFCINCGRQYGMAMPVTDVPKHSFAAASNTLTSKSAISILSAFKKNLDYCRLSRLMVAS